MIKPPMANLQEHRKWSDFCIEERSREGFTEEVAFELSLRKKNSPNNELDPKLARRGDIIAKALT